MIPIRLHLSGFLSYLDPVDVDFESFDLACISGQNGAGKSSLLDAITWVLFGEARRKDDSILNNNADAAEVIFTFDYEGSRFKVQRSKPRGKTTLLEFWQQDENTSWKVLTEATLRATDERIIKTLRLDYETFINASFFLQGKADQFAQQRPADRKRILTNTLGLEIWETYKEEALRRRREAESQLAIKEDRLAAIEEELAEEEDRKSRLLEAEKEYKSQKTLADTQKTLLDQQRLLHESLERDRTQILKQQAELTRQQQELQSKNQTLLARQQERTLLQAQLASASDIQNALAHWKKEREKLEEWDALSNQFQTINTQRQTPLQEVASEKARLETQLLQLHKTESEVAVLQAALTGKKTTLAQLQETISQLAEKINIRPTLEIDLHTLANERAAARAENQTLRAEMNALSERIDRISQVSGALCPVCGKPLSESERADLVRELQDQGKEKGDAFRKNQQAIKDCETRYQELEARIASLVTLEPENKNQQRRLDVLQHELTLDETNLANWQAQGQVELQTLIRRLQDQDYAQVARQQLTALDEQLNALGYDSAAHAAAREAEKAGRASQEAWENLEKARAHLVPLEREIEELHHTVEQQENRLNEMVTELSLAQKTLEQNQANLPDLMTLENEYYSLQENVNKLNDFLAARRNDVLVLENIKEQRKTLKSEKESLTARIAQLKLLERAFGKDGIPALLIEQALPEIESDANEILDRLSDGNMSVRFETQREFKDKKRDDRKETLDIIIHDGSGDRDYELFSGGEAFRINFAIRLALSRVLARRAGARLQTLVIDEGFGSQDAEGRQRLIEAINSVRGDFAKILVITHMEELKDAFSARIEVTKTEHGSRVEVIAA
ncbi:MAG: AAA family ATPase [Anaerolineaceae bacterium]